MAYGMQTMGPESLPGYRGPVRPRPGAGAPPPARPPWAPGTGPMPDNAPPGFDPRQHFMLGGEMKNIADYGDAVKSAWERTWATGGDPYRDKVEIQTMGGGAQPGLVKPPGPAPGAGQPSQGWNASAVTKHGSFGGGFGGGGQSYKQGYGTYKPSGQPVAGRPGDRELHPMPMGTQQGVPGGGSIGGGGGGGGPSIGGSSTVNTSINPTPIYTPQMTQEAVNQARASQLGVGDAAWLRSQAGGGGRALNSGSVMQSTMNPIAQGLAASARAGAQIPLQDAIANAQHILAGQRGRDSEFFGLAGIPMQQQGQQNDLLSQLLSMFGGLLGG